MCLLTAVCVYMFLKFIVFHYRWIAKKYMLYFVRSSFTHSNITINKACEGNIAAVVFFFLLLVYRDTDYESKNDANQCQES